MRRRRVPKRYVVLVVALLLSTPWGANAVNRVTTSAVRNVTDAVETVRGETRPEAEQPPRARTRAQRRRERRVKRTPQPPASAWQVTDVIDGDTIEVLGSGGRTDTVRIIGVDTPERDECGYAEASNTLTVMLRGRTVQLSPGAVDDRDRYSRLLRYVDVDGVDAGLALIEKGLAVARYDSRDGYGDHPREDAYVEADAAPDLCAGHAMPAPKSG